MHVLAFGGSTASNSINQQLATHAASFFEDSEVISLRDFEMPMFSVDAEITNGIPENALRLAQKIDASDLILISLAEHNGAYSTAFKNTFDWLSRIPNRSAWGNKNMVLLATSPGARGGASVLEIAKNRFPFNGGNIVGTFSLPNFGDNFANGAISNLELHNKLEDLLKSL